MRRKIFPSEYGNAIAMEYLKFLVSDEYIPEETARFFLNMSYINQKPLHFFYGRGFGRLPDISKPRA